jgi:hypothetical protein
MSSDLNRAIMNALNDKCTCHYTDDKDGNPVPSEQCTQCRAAFTIEALEGELFESRKVCGETFDAARKWRAKAEAAEARAERLREALEAIAVKAGTFDGMGSYTAYVMMAGQIEQMADAAIRAAAGGGE